MSASEAIQRHLAELLAGPDSHMRSIAVMSHALPVYSDMGGTLLITAELDLLSVAIDSDLAPASETSEQWRLIALVSAAARYPDLQCLLPVRPAEAPSCAHCAGKGWLVQSNFRCSECCGLGWQALRSNKPLQPIAPNDGAPVER
jgi:hypothetical protein